MIDPVVHPLRRLIGAATTDGHASFVLTVSFGLYWLLVLVWAHRVGGITEAEEWMIFVEGWTVVPILAFATTLVVRAVGSAWGAGQSQDDVALVVASAALASAASLRWSSSSDSTFAGACSAVIVLFPTLTVASLLTRGRLDCSARRRSSMGRSEHVRPLTLLLLASTVAITSLTVVPTVWRVVVIALVTGGMLAAPSMYRSSTMRWARHAWADCLIDAGVLLLLPLVLFDPHLHFDPIHHEWFLGPANAILHGRTLLVDVISAYGVGTIYFVALIFRAGLAPLSYAGFAMVLSALVILEYALIYFLLRLALRSRSHAVVAMAAVVLFHFVAVFGAYTVYPSPGPIRFAPPYIMVLLVALRSRSRAPLPWKIGEAALVGLASIWSTETFLFTLAAYVGAMSCEVVARRRKVPHWEPPTAVGLVWAVAFSAIAHGALAVYTYGRSGMWPQWPAYLDAVRAFGPAGHPWALAKASLWGGWIALAAIYFASGVGCLLSLARVRSARGAGQLTVAGAMTLTGIAQLSYYLGQSIYYRLYTVAIPAVWLVAFWWQRVALQLQLPRRPALRSVAYVGALIAVAQLWDPLTAWAPHSGIAALWHAVGSSAPANLRASPPPPSLTAAEREMMQALGPVRCSNLVECLRTRRPTMQDTADTLRLLDRYAPDAERAAIFVNFAATTEVCLLRNKAHVFPMSAASHDCLIPSNADRILAAPHGLHAGDVIFVNRGAVDLSRRTPPYTLLQGAQWFVTRMVDRVCREFRCVPVERIGAITAERLESRAPQQP